FWGCYSIYALSKNDLKDLAKTYRIPLDLHPRLPNLGLTMDCLLADAIGIYSEFLQFSAIRVPYSTFLLSVLKYFKMREELIVRFGLSSVWFNKECDSVFRRVDDNAEMSIYDFLTLPSWSDAKIVEESHYLSLALLERVPTQKGQRLQRQMDLLDCLARSALVRDDEYDQILDDDFGTATRGEEIDLTLFPLAPCPYHMPYPYEGVSSPLYTREEWNGPHASEHSILCKDIFKNPDVCMKALDRTITPVEHRRDESLLPLELSNRVNVLSALLVSHGYELNSRYTNLVSSKAHLQEKLDKKKGGVKLLRSEENRELHSQRDDAFEEVKKLQSQLTKAKTTSASLSEELTQTDAKLSKQALIVRDLQNELVLEKSKSQGYKDSIDGLREEVTQFVGSGMESLVRKLLSSDEFHAALAHVASLSINYGVERGLRIGRTDVEFEAAVQKVSNFHEGAKADFDKAVVDFPTTPFPFLSKIVAASGGTLSDVAQILPDKFVRSATSVSVAPSSVNEAPKQVPP
ncbi:hypothetical protein Tco_0501941, partial [Tanacetum coccineum]